MGSPVVVVVGFLFLFFSFVAFTAPYFVLRSSAAVEQVCLDGIGSADQPWAITYICRAIPRSTQSRYPSGQCLTKLRRLLPLQEAAGRVLCTVPCGRVLCRCPWLRAGVIVGPLPRVHILITSRGEQPRLARGSFGFGRRQSRCGCGADNPRMWRAHRLFLDHRGWLPRGRRGTRVGRRGARATERRPPRHRRARPWPPCTPHPAPF